MGTGFSLIEVLGVFVIIAILAALLFPVLGSAKRKAKTVSCLSNLHQLGAAVILYESDNDDSLPPLNPRTVFSVKPDPSDYLLSDPLLPYGSNAEVYHCPDYVGDKRLSPAITDFTIRFGLAQAGSDRFYHFWQIRPEPSTVIIFCRWNLERPMIKADPSLSNGSFNVLRNEGTVQRVQSNKVTEHRGGFGTFPGWDTHSEGYLQFPDETFPPQVDQVE